MRAVSVNATATNADIEFHMWQEKYPQMMFDQHTTSRLVFGGVLHCKCHVMISLLIFVLLSYRLWAETTTENL